MPFTDLDAALCCECSYFTPGYFDTIFQGEGDDEVWCGIKHVTPDTCVITFRGSCDFTDWLRDFHAEMITDPLLNQVEDGFMQGLMALLPRVQAEIDHATNIYVTGHSLGAARAILFGALLELKEPSPDAIIVFGCPRPGGSKLKDILQHTTIRSYRNGNDPVTLVPLDLVIDPYVAVVDPIQIEAPAITPDLWLALKDHRIQNYVNAMALKVGGYHAKVETIVKSVPTGK